jgi:glutamate/tyrosine decarboxylase-like PLP-dependent enzyme
VISVGALPVNSSAADGPKWLLIKILAACVLIRGREQHARAHTHTRWL